MSAGGPSSCWDSPVRWCSTLCLAWPPSCRAWGCCSSRESALGIAGRDGPDGSGIHRRRHISGQSLQGYGDHRHGVRIGVHVRSPVGVSGGSRPARSTRSLARLRSSNSLLPGAAIGLVEASRIAHPRYDTGDPGKNELAFVPSRHGDPFRRCPVDHDLRLHVLVRRLRDNPVATDRRARHVAESVPVQLGSGVPDICVYRLHTGPDPGGRRAAIWRGVSAKDCWPPQERCCRFSALA